MNKADLIKATKTSVGSMFEKNLYMKNLDKSKYTNLYNSALDINQVFVHPEHWNCLP